MTPILSFISTPLWRSLRGSLEINSTCMFLLLLWFLLYMNRYRVRRMVHSKQLKFDVSESILHLISAINCPRSIRKFGVSHMQHVQMMQIECKCVCVFVTSRRCVVKLQIVNYNLYELSESSSRSYLQLTALVWWETNVDDVANANAHTHQMTDAQTMNASCRSSLRSFF